MRATLRHLHMRGSDRATETERRYDFRSRWVTRTVGVFSHFYPIGRGSGLKKHNLSLRSMKANEHFRRKIEQT